MREFFNYYGTESVLRRQCPEKLRRDPFHKWCLWVLIDGGAQNRHVAQLFRNAKASSGILNPTWKAVRDVSESCDLASTMTKS